MDILCNAEASGMDARPAQCHILPMEDPTSRPVADWQADLAISEEQAASGRTVSMAPGRARLRESIRQLEAKLGDGRPRKAAPHR
jgi:hypothetical protein